MQKKQKKSSNKGKQAPKNQSKVLATTIVGTQHGGSMPLWSGVNIPQLQRVCLRYSGRTLMTVASGISAKYVIRQNSLYDPDYTSSGSQPQYYDFWTNLYQTYRVWDCKIKVTFSAQTNTVPFTCVLFPWNDVSTPSGTIDDYAALPLAKSVNLGAQGSGDSVKSITMSGCISQMMATVNALDPQDYLLYQKSATSGNAVNDVTFVMAVNSADGNTSNTSIAMKFEILYFADMTTPKTIYTS